MKSKDRWVISRSSIYNLGYHIIWCPKYRKDILVDKVEARLKNIIIEKAEELKCKICCMEIMPNHVHLFIKTPPTISVHFLVQQIKGKSAHILREEFPHLKKKMPSMWTRSYYAESVGHISEETIKRYIEEQKGK